MKGNLTFHRDVDQTANGRDEETYGAELSEQDSDFDTSHCKFASRLQNSYSWVVQCSVRSPLHFPIYCQFRDYNNK